MNSLKIRARAAALVLGLAVVFGCASREHQEWVRNVTAANQAWHACAMNATMALSRQYSDPEMISRYALHQCEPQKKVWQDMHFNARGIDKAKARAEYIRYEEEFRLKLQMFATKSMADQDAEWAQAFPEPLVFR